MFKLIKYFNLLATTAHIKIKRYENFELREECNTT